MGELEKALEHLLTAIRLDPLYPTAHYRLGTLYRQLGREAEARQELEAFQKLEESRKQIDEVYQRTRPGLPETDLIESNAPQE